MARAEGDLGEEDLGTVHAAIEECANAGLPLSTTEPGIVVARLAENSHLAASWLLAAWIDPGEITQTLKKPSHEGQLPYAASAMGIAQLLECQLIQADVEEFVQADQKRLDRLGAAVEALQKKADAAVARLDAQDKRAAGKDAEIGTMMTNARKSYAQHLHLARRRLGRVEDLYDKRLALLKPVAYWTNKRGGHHRMWSIYGGAALVFFLIFVFVSWYAAKSLELLPPSAEGTTQIAESPTAAVRPAGGENVGERLSRVALLGVMLGVFAWPLRLLIRQFQAEGQFREDARHRETLTMTYLALLREDADHDSSDQRMLVLSHLFAPVGSESADDGMPNGNLAFLSALLSGRKGPP